MQLFVIDNDRSRCVFVPCALIPCFSIAASLFGKEQLLIIGAHNITFQ